MSTNAPLPAAGKPSLRLSGLIVLAAASLLLASGCTHPTVNRGPAPLPGKISVNELAQRLGLSVVSSSSQSAVLRNSCNTVMIFGDPAGEAYVNGQQVGPSGDFRCVGDTLYMPEGIEGFIRRAMRNSPVVYVPGETPKNPGRTAPPRDVPDNVRVKGRVVIDAGHGGKDPGAQAGGASEKTINLAVARAVADCLKAHGVEVLMTRTDDRFIELSDRINLANQNHANLFVAIHADSSTDRSNRGHTIIMPEASSSESAAAAREISTALASAGSPVHSVRKDVRHLRVLSINHVPAVIVELGFLTNPADASRLTNGNSQQKMGYAIAEGIMAYLKK